MASFPGLYRARAVDTNGRKVTAFVPAVFGEEPITIVDAINALPSDPGTGWVFFQAGNPEFPVWVGQSSGSGSGADEVWVGTEIPTPDTTYELWYDTDAIPPAPGSAEISHVHYQSVASALWTVDHNLGWFPNILVVDSAGTNVEGDVTHVNANQMTIAFSGSFTGKAYLS